MAMIHSRVMSVLPIFLGISLLGSLEATGAWMMVVIGIGFLIFVHELGHFLVAKREKVRVEAFALGFGYPLLRKKWGETEYRINLLPLGGYVKMAGETPGEESTGSPDEFMSKKPAARARIIVAGVLMNFIFGLLGVILAFKIGVQFPDATIGAVAPGSPAWHAGIQKGDLVLEIDGQKVTKFKEVKLGIAFGKAAEGINLKVQRLGEVFSCQVKPEYNKEMGLLLIGISPFLDKIQVEKESLFYKAGLRSGDRIIEVDGKKIVGGHELYATLARTTGPTVQMVVEREGQTLSFSLQPESKTAYRLGLLPNDLGIKAVRRNSLAQKAGFLPNDWILAVDKKNIHSSQALFASLEKAGTASILVRREGKEVEISLDFPALNTTGVHFLQDLCFTTDLYVGETLPDFPAEGHLFPGDKILAMNEKPLSAWSDLSEKIAATQGKPLSIRLLRNGETLTISLTPKVQPELNFESLALLPKMGPVQSYGIVDACKAGLHDAKEMIMDIFLMLRGLFSRDISAKNLGGPIIIFTASYNQLQMGLGYFIYFLALISINLAVINLFPIPVLDGGLLAILLWEAIRGKKVSEKILIGFNYLGFALLLSLLLYVTYHDILRLIGLM